MLRIEAASNTSLIMGRSGNANKNIYNFIYVMSILEEERERVGVGVCDCYA